MHRSYRRVKPKQKMSDELSQQQHQIALYYLYTPRPLPQELLSQHIQFQKDVCSSLSLHGRIRVSCEGINGVLSGRTVDLRQYEEQLHDELTRIFACSNVEDNDAGSGHDISFDLDIKYCKLRPDIPAEQQLFDSLSVKQTREVVSLYELKNEPDPNKKGRRGGRQARKWRQRQRQLEQEQQQQQENAQEQAFGSDQLSKQEQCNGEQSNHSSVVPTSPEDIDLTAYPPAHHLSPEQWNQQLQSEAEGDAVLLDARNVYESKVGHFAVPGVPTLLPNTRKYSSLPAVFDATSEKLAGKKVYMYCTGGVRCERASAYLQALADSDRWKGDKPVEIYQLKGGIQRYLEAYGSMNKGRDEEGATAKSDSTSSETCLYKGRNFVFDPRRTDPVVGPGCAGKCLLCSVPHDDYDNGHAPCDNKEARCCRCRVLVLICNDCRSKMRCFGEVEADDKPDLFCGPNGEECIDEGNNISVDII